MADIRPKFSLITPWFTGSPSAGGIRKPVRGWLAEMVQRSNKEMIAWEANVCHNRATH
jgi:hypothetical protein